MATTHHQTPKTQTPLWFCPQTGIYKSKHPSLNLPTNPNLSSVTFLFSHTHNKTHQTALIDSLTGFSIPHTTLPGLVKSIASNIYHNLNIRQGDVVSLMLPNSVYFPLLFLSLLSLGVIVTTLNPLSSLNEIKKQVSECNVCLAFACNESFDKLKSLGVLVIRVPESYDFDVIRIENPMFYAIFKGDSEAEVVVRVKQDDVAVIMYSSGTTGGSKGVLLTHGNLIASMELFVRFEAKQYDVYLAVLPFCHIYGLSLFVMGLLSVGSTVVVMRRFDVDVVVDVIERFKVTHFPVVPPMLMALTKKAKGVCCGDVFRSLKQVSSGAAPLSRKFIDDFVLTFPHVDLIQGYGMTESTAVGTRGLNSEKVRKYSSVGLLAPNMKAKVVDWSSGSFLPPGNRGELWIQGPGVMKGYLNNPKATQMTIVEDGWLRTGDIAYFDDDGYLFIVDRIKEVIKYKGFQIAPADLEAVLVSHPLIIDAAVTAAPNEECGEIPVAFVVRRQGSTLSEQDVISYVASQVAPYRKVRKVVMVNSIPKSPAGKILRKELKRRLTNCVTSRL